LHGRNSQRPRSVVILRALNLGDLLCATPAWRALRAALPDAQLCLVGLPWAREFVQRFHHLFDDFIEFPGYPELPEQTPQLAAIPAFLAEVQSRRFDLALQMQGSGGVSNPLTLLFGARETAGFYAPGQFCPDPERFLPYPDDLPEVHRHLRLMAALGVPSQGEGLEFPLREADRDALGALPEAAALLPGRYVCIHPGARAAARRWAPAQFAAVAGALGERGFTIVLTGTAEEAPLTAAVAAALPFGAVDLCGRTSLGALAALFVRSCLVVCNDTGASHLAAALGVPSVVIVTGSDPRRWSPLDAQHHRVLEHATVASVLTEAAQLLEQESAYAV
jgi:ADP-heptose:LPS heptosyltransferase